MNFNGRCKGFLSFFMFLFFSNVSSFSLLNFKNNLLYDFLGFCSFLFNYLKFDDCSI